MIIKVEYNSKKCKAIVIEDYKVSISSEDAGCQDLISEKTIELDQCLRCGVWCSEDDEMYEGGYCDYCSAWCDECELYYSIDDVIYVSDGTYICNECRGK